jgi:hypothetical protein
LNETLGFTSPKQLNVCRQRAIDAGWLYYVREHDRSVGNYWTLIPLNVTRFNDQPIESNDSLSVMGTRNGTRLGIAVGTQEGIQPGTENGKPSNPIPRPSPSPSIIVVEDSFSFGSFLFSDVRASANRLRDVLPKHQQDKHREVIWRIAFAALWIEGPALVERLIRTVGRNKPQHVADYLESGIRKACVERGENWHTLKDAAPACPVASDSRPAIAIQPEGKQA